MARQASSALMRSVRRAMARNCTSSALAAPTSGTRPRSAGSSWRHTAIERRTEITAKARAAATERRPAPKLSGRLLVRAKELWIDPKLTAAQVDAEVGVPVRTLYRRLGERGTPSFGKGVKR